MPEQLTTYRDSYEVIADDLNGMQKDRQDALDNVVVDTLVSDNRFSGFPVSNPTSTDVLVGNGRLYTAGKVYFNDTPGGATIPLATLRPSLTSKIVAIVAVPKDQENNTQERDYETDATTETFEPRSVTMNTQRWADLQAVPGPELVSPTPPVVPTTVLVIAYVTMTTAGITAITMVDANAVPNLEDVDTRTGTLEEEFADVSAKTRTITDDLAKLQAALAGLAGLQAITSLSQDVARLKAKANLPAAYVNYRENDFTDLSGSDPTYSGYAAKVDSGLRFAPDAIAANQMQVQNQYDPLAAVSAGGILLPKYTKQYFRIVRGLAGTMSLTQYSQQPYGLVQTTMSRQRIRFGAEFEQAVGSSFFAGSMLSADGKTLQKDGETFQVYDTGQVNPDGQELERLANYWTDTVTTPYWDRVTTTPGSGNGYLWCQTWLQDQSGWCLGLTPNVAVKPATGPLTVAICACTNGQPDETNIIALATVNPADIVVNPVFGTWDIPIEPTFLQAGTRYGLLLITQAGYTVNVGDISTNAGGTCFYKLDGGVWYPSPSQNILFNLTMASFPQSQVSIQLASLSLPGGIAAIDILASTIVPANTLLTYEVQINGVWTALGEASAGALATLPPLVFLRVTMTGSANLMPGLTLAGSVAKVSRPKTTLKHGSIVETLASSSSKISIKSTLIDFNPAHHTYTGKVLAGGVLKTVDTTTDVVIDARTLERTQVFNLASAATSYVSELDGTSDNAAALFHVASTFELAA